MAAARNIVVAVDELDDRFISGVDVQVGSAVLGLLNKTLGQSPRFVGPRIANGGSFRVGWQTPSPNRRCPEVALRLPPANGLNPFGIGGADDLPDP